MKTYRLLFTILLTLSMLCGCTSNAQILVNQVGNSSGNIINGGYAAYYDNYIYYVNGLDIGLTSDNKLYRVNSDWTNKQLITNDKVQYINIIRGWIYYGNLSDSNTQNGGKIYKMKLDGSEKCKINDNDSTYLNVNGDWIYYINNSDGEWNNSNKLYKIKTDGTGEQVICNDVCDNLIVSGDWLYYLSRVKVEGSQWTYKLFKIREDGTKKTKLSDEGITSFLLTGNYIIYHSTAEGLWRIDLSGEEKKIITDEQVLDYNSDGEWVYYCNLNDNEKLNKISIDGNNKQKMNDSRTYNIHLIGDWIYYACAQAEYTDSYRIKLDGNDELAIT